jgi:hypothetical protein
MSGGPENYKNNYGKIISDLPKNYSGIKEINQLSFPIPPITSNLLGKNSQENPQRIKEELKDDVARPDFSIEQVERLQRENDQLRRQNGQLKTDNERLKARNGHLETTTQRSEADLAQAKGEAQRLRRQNEHLQFENDKLGIAVKAWKLEAQSASATARTPKVDVLDPKGYCKTFGIDPRLVRGLPADKFERLLRSVYHAYSLVYHPDTGGDTEAMKALNAAYDFLKDPQNRKVYGR